MSFDCVIKASAEDGLINKIEVTSSMWGITTRPIAFSLGNAKEQITDALHAIGSGFTSTLDGVYEINGNEVGLAFEGS